MTLFKLIHRRNPLTPLISVNGGKEELSYVIKVFFCQMQRPEGSFKK